MSLYEKQREWEAVMAHPMLFMYVIDGVHPQHNTGMRMYAVFSGIVVHGWVEVWVIYPF